MIRDTRRSRGMLVVALSAALGAVLGEYFIRPTLKKTIT